MVPEIKVVEEMAGVNMLIDRMDKRKYPLIGVETERKIEEQTLSNVHVLSIMVWTLGFPDSPLEALDLE